MYSHWLPRISHLTENDVHHLNSILQPCTATDAPVVGVAITAETMVPGCATGATHATDVEEAARFMLEVAKAYGKKNSVVSMMLMNMHVFRNCMEA